MNTHTILHQAEGIFLRPRVTYPYSSIISGVKVCGKVEPQKAVGRNTFRGFYRAEGAARGASAVFDPYFLQQKDRILSALRSMTSREDLDTFCDVIKEEIKSRLTNVNQRQLESYNKVRKPVDLYIEHIVSMSEELSETDRTKLGAFLFLPLDSWIFGSELVFTEDELSQCGLSRRSTYKDVSLRTTYSQLHSLTLKKARAISPTFHPIYFDLIWGDRFLRKEARSLFESNP